MPQHSAVPVIQKQQKGNMSRLQRQFNHRIKKIQQLKTELEALEQAMPELRSLLHQELQPIQDKIADMKAQIVKRLDQAWEMKFFRHKEKAKLQEIICTFAFPLIQQQQHPELETIYDKHAPVSYQKESEWMNETTRDMASDMLRDLFGMDVDLDGVDMNDFGQLHEKLSASMEEKAQREEEREKNKKKTKAQQAREEKMKAENEHISRTSRAVYTRLVKEFHPDKEADEEKRLWKTEVMKRVTQAYQQDDFFGLLSLEIELMKGRAHDIGALPDQQLKYYTKMLKEQIDELQMQLDAMTNPPPPFDRAADRTMAPYLQNIRHAPAMIEQDKQELQSVLNSMERDLERFADKKNIRAFLRDYQLEEEQYDDEDLFFFDFDEFGK